MSFPIDFARFNEYRRECKEETEVAKAKWIRDKIVNEIDLLIKGNLIESDLLTMHRARNLIHKKLVKRFDTKFPDKNYTIITWRTSKKNPQLEGYRLAAQQILEKLSMVKPSLTLQSDGFLLPPKWKLQVKVYC